MSDDESRADQNSNQQPVKRRRKNSVTSSVDAELSRGTKPDVNQLGPKERRLPPESKKEIHSLLLHNSQVNQQKNKNGGKIK